MEREDILRIITESPLTVYLSDKDKMEIIDRILAIWNHEINSEHGNTISES